MSSHFFLYCEQTGECVEAIARVGNWCGPRIEANALQAFLVYHHIKAGGAMMRIVELESISRDRNIVASLEEAVDEKESIGDFAGYKAPVMIWTEKNFRELAARADRLVAALEDYAQAPSGGTWVRRTVEGRLIEACGSTVTA